MSSSIQEDILRCMYGVMRSISRLLLRHGIGFREFSEISKAAFVHVATEDYGIRGRPTNISRVAVMTGLTRKEVKRLRDLSSGYSATMISRRNPLAELLHYWNTDNAYCDKDGQPIDIPFDGEDVCFLSLVKRCAGDIPAGAIRTELKRTGAISETSSGLLSVNTREHLPKDADQRLINGLRYGLQTLADTIDFNGNPSTRFPRPQKLIHSSEVDPEKQHDLEIALRKRIEEFSIETDNFLSTVEAKPGQVTKLPLQTIGVGVYFYIEE